MARPSFKEILEDLDETLRQTGQLKLKTRRLKMEVLGELENKTKNSDTVDLQLQPDGTWGNEKEEQETKLLNP